MVVPVLGAAGGGVGAASQAESGLLVVLEQLPGDPLQLVHALVGRAVERASNVQLDVRGDADALPGGPLGSRARSGCGAGLGDGPDDGPGRGRRAGTGADLASAPGGGPAADGGGTASSGWVAAIRCRDTPGAGP